MAKKLDNLQQELEKCRRKNGGENHIEDRLESEGGIW